MKKYFFALFLFILALISIDIVYGAPIEGWAYSKKMPSLAYVTDCGNSGCATDLSPNTTPIDSSHYYFYQDSRTTMSANGSGIMWSYMLDNTLKSGYLYSISTFVCHESSANFVYKGSYSSDTLSYVQNLSQSGTVYFSNAMSNLSTMPYNNSTIMQKCGALIVLYKPNNNSKYYGVNFSVSSNSNYYTSSLLGYEIQSLGIATQLTQQDIQNAINSSGLASASDISQVNSSLASIQSSINNNIDQAETNIINSQEQTRDAIIQNQNENTDKEIESQKVCKKLVFNSSSDYSQFTSNSYITNTGDIYTSPGFRLSPYFADVTKITRTLSWSNPNVNRVCFFNESYTLISCNDSESDGVLTIPTNTKYIRFNSYASTSSPNYTLESCKNGNQALSDNINNVNDTLNNSDSSGATGDAGSFFSGFTTNTFGLTSIIIAPLNLINSLTSKTCSPLTLQIPFVNQNLDLPCMTTIYQTHFGSFLTVYQTITFGFISYWVCIRIFALVKDFKNPDHDEIEVMDL